ncbi:hypothetical protein ONO57_25735, partial [Salmonella enterica subsp. enterica serovar Anatum]|nr:hypothetical protein [Salmonella enterica subsp. enterica serovar Anatum]
TVAPVRNGSTTRQAAVSEPTERHTTRPERKQAVIETKKPQTTDSSFFPQNICLGDILKNSGYQNYFVQGANLRFAGKDVFLKSHG